MHHINDTRRNAMCACVCVFLCLFVCSDGDSVSEASSANDVVLSSAVSPEHRRLPQQQQQREDGQATVRSTESTSVSVTNNNDKLAVSSESTHSLVLRADPRGCGHGTMPPNHG